MRFLVLHPLLMYLYVRYRYAMWALNYVPPLIDGKFNPEYQKLSNWINEYAKAYADYLEGK
jgi:hypothetical protein